MSFLQIPFLVTNINLEEKKDGNLLSPFSYFSSIGPNLAKEIHSSVSHHSFLSGHFCQPVFFDSVTPNELSEISNAFRPGKAAGHDRIPIPIIKKNQSIQIIADPLAHIINLSITHGMFPTK